MPRNDSLDEMGDMCGPPSFQILPEMSPKLKKKKEKTKIPKPVTKKNLNPDSIPNLKDENLSKALYRIHKRVHPELAISSKAIGVMNSIVNHLFHKLAAEVSRLSHKGDPVWTLSTDNVQMAVRLMLPGNLCKNAIDAVTKALALHSVSDSGPNTDKSQSTLGNLPEAVGIWWEDPGTSEECNTDGASITDGQNLRCILTAGLPAGKVKTKKVKLIDTVYFFLL